MLMQIVLIDHYDSFTQNVLDWLDPGDGVLSVELIAFDDQKAMRRQALAGFPLVLSPGPKHPENAVPTLAVVREMQGKVPILGICLGHQILCLAAGARIVREVAPFHGSARAIDLTDPDNLDLFKGLPRSFEAAVYNSLTVSTGALPAEIDVLAKGRSGEIQAARIRYAEGLPAYGVQFHPESYLSIGIRAALRANWVALVRHFYRTAIAPLSAPS